MRVPSLLNWTFSLSDNEPSSDMVLETALHVRR